MSLKAKYPGKCPLCFVRFVVGQDDIENRQGKWVHVDCKLAKASQEAPGHAAPKSSGEVTSFSYKSILPRPVEENKHTEQAADNLTAFLDEQPAPVEIIHEEKVFTPSVYQKAIYEYIEQMLKGVSVSMHLVIEAVAGSGKTTTIVQALKLISEEYRVAFIAYNKHIATELQKRAPAYVYVSTMHSLGLAVIRKNIKGAKVDEKNEKLNSILNNLFPVLKSLVQSGKITNEERKENFVKRQGMRNLVSMAMSTLIDVYDVSAIRSTIDRYGMEVEHRFQEELIEKLPDVLEQIKRNPTLVSFDEMIWLPIALDMNFEKFDFFFGDEWQDMNRAQIEFALRSITKNGHIIAVGDRKQSIYGFRFADTQAIPRTIEALKADTLPLSVTYRSPVSHVNLAKEIVPQIEPRENAPEGLIENIKYRNLVGMLEPGDLVICRTNAPLVAPAFECIRQGKKAIIRGKDGIGSQLIALVNRFEAATLAELEINLNEYYENEFQRLVDNAKELQAAMLTDRVNTLKFIMAECDTVQQLIDRINSLFDDKAEGIVFSSIHRAKGLEAERVFFLGPEIVPHPKATKDWEIEQEDNTKYVALTRSKANMYFIPIPKK